MAKENPTKNSLITQKDVNKTEQDVQELTDTDVEALIGGTMKTATVATVGTVTLAGSVNPLCVCAN
jgi:hypothetical protein